LHFTKSPKRRLEAARRKTSPAPTTSSVDFGRTPQAVVVGCVSRFPNSTGCYPVRRSAIFGTSMHRFNHKMLQFEEQLDTVTQSVIPELPCLINQVHCQFGKYMGRKM
jgi:hypothetical protein